MPAIPRLDFASASEIIYRRDEPSRLAIPQLTDMKREWIAMERQCPFYARADSQTRGYGINQPAADVRF